MQTSMRNTITLKLKITMKFSLSGNVFRIFYMNYYVYQYATGFAAASYLAEKIVHGNEEDKEAYLTYLKAGSSDYPLEVIKKAGVDMTNTDYLDAAFKVSKTA